MGAVAHAFGLRLRSCGENPQAAETLGVNVYRYKFVAVIVSGALAGLGGGFLALVASSGFSPARPAVAATSASRR